MFTKRTKLDVIRKALKLIESPTYRRDIGVKYDDDLPLLQTNIKEADQKDARVRRAYMLALCKLHPLITSTEFVEWFRYEFPDISDDRHLSMAYEVFPNSLPWSIEKTCGNETCPTTAYGVPDALDKFGHRNGGKTLQSYCKKCRREDAAARRERRKNAIRLGITPKDMRKKERKKEEERKKRPKALDPRKVLEPTRYKVPADPTKDGPGLTNGFKTKAEEMEEYKVRREAKKLLGKIKADEDRRRRRIKGKR